MYNDFSRSTSHWKRYCLYICRNSWTLKRKKSITQKKKLERYAKWERLITRGENMDGYNVYEMGTDDNVVVAFDENLFRLYKQTQKRGWKWTELLVFPS